VLDDDPATTPAATAAVVVRTTCFDTDLAFFVDELGLALDRILPADDPAVAEIVGAGLRVRIERTPDVRNARPAHLRLAATPERTTGRLTSPGGSTIDVVPSRSAVPLPPNRPTLVVSRADDASDPVTGRAGMRYRDLLPDRWGGRFIASHIHIPDGGPVPDYVHYHRIRFQVIVVRAGWVDVVYEGQGEPFRMHPGDCVLQPPQIRHRVLRSSDDLEVIEVGCPAEHETVVDRQLGLPTPTPTPGRSFSGQRFVRHVAAGAPTGPWRWDGWTARDSGIGDATDGLAGVRFAVPGTRPADSWAAWHTELALLVVMEGAVRFEAEDLAPVVLGAADSVAIPGGLRHRLAAPSDDLVLCDVTLPARPEVTFPARPGPR
jgi:quercetin dioxygenase-like cupin family protein